MRNSTNNITTLKFNQNKKDLIQTILPTEEEFKKEAWKLKEEQGIKLTVALNQLSVKYGYKSFNAIKPELYKKLIWSPNIKNSELDDEGIFKNFIDTVIENNKDKKVKIIKLNIPGISTSKIKSFYNKFHDYIAAKKYSIEQF